ncbi:MAG: hypothetical protein EKK55_22680 [Rhodocyclaceae bacterium]|nr:MAG: hypothetical protein EKK55_22680 [Rhodocyclaceae bacterium]
MNHDRIKAAIGDDFILEDRRVNLGPRRHTVVKQLTFNMRRDDVRMVAALAVIEAKPWFVTGVGEKVVYAFKATFADDSDAVSFLGDEEPVTAVLEAMAGAGDRQHLGEAELRRRLAVQDACLGRRVFDEPADYRQSIRRDIAQGFSLLRDDVDANCKETLRRYDVLGRKERVLG